MKESSKFHCALCGHDFEADRDSCPSACPLGKHCNLVCCPNCGYSFPRESRVVELIKGLFKKQRSNHGLTS